MAVEYKSNCESNHVKNYTAYKSRPIFLQLRLSVGLLDGISLKLKAEYLWKAEEQS